MIGAKPGRVKYDPVVVTVLTVTIEALDDDGRGVGTADALEVHVAGALPGETVRARVDHRSPHAPRAWAAFVELVSPPSAERVSPACPAFGRCGGCVLQHLCYPAQLTEKRRRVERALASFPDVAVADVVASPRELHYRNKAKYVVAADYLLGSYAPGTHEVVDMGGCQVVEEPIETATRAARHALRSSGVPPYDERARVGELRYVVARANHDGRVLLVVVTATEAPRTALAGAAHRLRAEAPAVVGVVHNVNPQTSGVIFGRTDHTLDGDSSLPDVVAGVRLELSARAFFQVNRGAAARLYEEVGRLVEPRRGLRVVDLYCGVGGIALYLAARGADVVGVDTFAGGVADARRSAAALALPARFVVADAARGLAEPADVVVVNPPRKGLSPETRAALRAARPPRLVYVSCGPASLGADLGDLAGAYDIASVRPFDLMPGTPQVETVVLLRSRGSAPRGRGGR